MIYFSIPGEPVIKKNNRPIYRAGNRPIIGKSAKLRQAEASIKSYVMSKYKGPTAKGSIEITFTAYLGTKRRKDLSNCFEIYADALQAAGVFADDNQIEIITMHKRYDKDNPRVEIGVAEL